MKVNNSWKWEEWVHIRQDLQLDTLLNRGGPMNGGRRKGKKIEEDITNTVLGEGRRKRIK